MGLPIVEIAKRARKKGLPPPTTTRMDPILGDSAGIDGRPPRPREDAQGQTVMPVVDNCIDAWQTAAPVHRLSRAIPRLRRMLDLHPAPAVAPATAARRSAKGKERRRFGIASVTCDSIIPCRFADAQNCSRLQSNVVCVDR